MEKQTNDEIEISLAEIFHVIRAKLWIILLSGFLTAAGAYLVSSFFITPVYASRSQLYILSKSNTLMSLQDLQLGSQLTQDYMVMAKSRPVVTQVTENLGLDISYDEMLHMIEISNPSNTRILELKVEYPDASMAKTIVDELARVSSIQIAKIMDTEVPAIVEEGFIQQTPVRPDKRRNTIIGGFLGLLVSAAAVIILHIMNDTIKDAEDVERYLGLTTLGLIPAESGGTPESGKGGKKGKQKINAAKRGKG